MRASRRGEAQVHHAVQRRAARGRHDQVPVRPLVQRAFESLTWEHAQELEANSPAAAAGPGTIPRDTRPDRGAGSADRHSPRQPEQDASRPNAAPAYHLGRPAWLWLSAAKPRRRPTPLAAAQTRTGGGTKPANPAGGAQPEPSWAIPGQRLHSGESEAPRSAMNHRPVSATASGTRAGWTVRCMMAS
jgi:hypothetical protein